MKGLPDGSVLRGASSLMCKGSQNTAEEERFSLAAGYSWGFGK